MSSHFTPFTLKDISRPGGGFAMLAVDQREAMRLMFAAAGQPKPIADSVLTDFKVAATRILSPYASAITWDKKIGSDNQAARISNSALLDYLLKTKLFIRQNGRSIRRKDSGRGKGRQDWSALLNQVRQQAGL